MPRVVHFEFHADDPQRAAQFYQNVFDWKISKWDGPVDYWMIQTGEDTPGIDGGIMKGEQPGATFNTIDVPSLDEYVQKVEAAGGRVVLPKHAVPGVGYLAYCTDTEGCTFGLMESDPAAQ
jgi:uncharacterized protein